jgi:uncharacterized protein
MSKQQQIEEFLTFKTLALVGISRNGKKFGNSIYKELSAKGYNILPVNPYADAIDGIKCYPNFQSLDTKPDGLIISVGKKYVIDVLKQAQIAGIDNIWMQQGSNTPEALEFCKKNNIQYISGKCILMYIEPVTGVHGFHRWLSKLFGGLYK